MKRKMTQDEILYAMNKLVLIYKGERGSFIRSQGWGVTEFDREMDRRLMADEFRNGIYNPVIRPEIRAKYEGIGESAE
jgi:hypothetical protein